MQLETLGFFGIAFAALARFWPVWLALAIVVVLSLSFKRRLGLYGQLFDTGVGLAGVTICLFWLFTAIFAEVIAPFDPLQQVALLKDAPPGTIDPGSGSAFLFGGDRLARDVFSRMIFGSRIVLAIAPAATLFALMIGVT